MKSCVLWFTGLSGSGKSTISERVFELLKSMPAQCEYLDGDIVRNFLGNTGFSKEERESHLKNIAFMSSRLEAHGVIVVASFISPYRSSRDYARKICKNLIEVYVSTPLEECERRDVKGLYKKARKGEITQFTGIDDPYEAPSNPEINIDTTNMSIEDCVAQVMNYLELKILK